MVSLWPFRGASSSAESFEKTLAALSTKISSTSAKNDRLRQRARRLKVGWSIYGGFTYILAVLILVFVTGRASWGVVEYTILAGGPVTLYAVRQGLEAWYNYRISTTQEYLDSLYKERDATIEKLKTATKYNSTQQLLEKYGAPKPSVSKQSPNSGKKSKGSRNEKPGERVFMTPPPTANIPKNRPPQPDSPQLPSPPQRPPSSELRPTSPQGPPITEEFAPNAFVDPAQYTSAPSFGESRWYDRILDALLGEDETQAKNRVALICQTCRLVNGQAPPGARSAEEVGRWRCQGCQAWNGVEPEAQKLVNQAKQRLGQSPGDHPAAAGGEVSSDEAVGVGQDADNTEEDASDEEDKEEVQVEPPARSKRSGSKATKRR